MNETVLTVEDAARTLPAVVDHVQSSGEAAVLLKSGLPVARIVPFSTQTDGTNDVIAFLRTWRSQHPEPDEQFADAIRESRHAIRPPHDPWE